jgi:hypothetical protein
MSDFQQSAFTSCSNSYNTTHFLASKDRDIVKNSTVVHVPPETIETEIILSPLHEDRSTPDDRLQINSHSRINVHHLFPRQNGHRDFKNETPEKRLNTLFIDIYL